MSPRRGHTRLLRPALRETVAIARPPRRLAGSIYHGEYQADIKSYDDSCSDEESYEGSSSDSLARPALEPSPLEDFFVRQRVRLVANTGGVNMTTFDVFLSVLLPAPSPALPEAMAGDTSMGGYLDTARATQLVDIVR